MSAIDKEKIRKATILAINKMPSKAKIYRETKNKYGEPTGYDLISEVTGVFYKDSRANASLRVDDIGKIISTNIPKFLVDYNDQSKVINRLDLIELENGEKYLIIDPNNCFDIYMDMTLEHD